MNIGSILRIGISGTIGIMMILPCAAQTAQPSPHKKEDRLHAASDGQLAWRWLHQCWRYRCRGQSTEGLQR